MFQGELLSSILSGKMYKTCGKPSFTLKNKAHDEVAKISLSFSSYFRKHTEGVCCKNGKKM